MQREQLSVDVLFVGAGPANLAGAYRLAKSLQDIGKSAEICVIEKAQHVGDHILSGAVMDPKAMEELFGPDWHEECPVEARVCLDRVFFLGAETAFNFPFQPPTLNNDGLWLVSLSKVTAWLKEKVEALGVMICEGMPGQEVLFDGDRVIGVRTMDMSLDKSGQPTSSTVLGTDIHAKVTVFGEGSRGSLTKQLVDRLDLHGPNPQIYGTGIKEIWDIPEGRMYAGEVWHTAGWPLTNEQYGGSWVYAFSKTRVSIGFVSALDSGDPNFDPYDTMQRWKTHPKIKELLAGGTLVKSGAKTVPEGGFWSRPKSYGSGFLIVGDSGSNLNISRLKGIHTAMKTGMMAADTITQAIAVDTFDAATLSFFERLFEQSWVHTELWKTRNWRQSFRYGFWVGGMLGSLMLYTGGRLLRNRVPVEADFLTMDHAHWGKEPVNYDRQLTYDKETGVYHAGSIHNEHQPSHLLVADTNICRTKCKEEYGNPCENFCPAKVYEMVDTAGGGSDLRVNFSNCVHCKTCDVMDPYAIITWTVPTDAGGPKYMGM